LRLDHKSNESAGDQTDNVKRALPVKNGGVAVGVFANKTASIETTSTTPISTTSSSPVTSIPSLVAAGTLSTSSDGNFTSFWFNSSGWDYTRTRSTTTVVNYVTLTPPPSTTTTSDLEVVEVPPIETSSPPCIEAKPDAPITSYSIVYTATTTFYGNSTDYTPPFVPIETPLTCMPAENSPVELTTICYTESKTLTCVTRTMEGWRPVMSTTTVKGKAPVSAPMVVTLITTEKNPSVVYSPVKTPGYGMESRPVNDHVSVVPTAGGAPAEKNPAGPQSMKLQTTPPTYVVTVAPSKVIINQQTYSDIPADVTTRVTVDGEVFTINPSQVIGGGSTVDRPAPPGGVFVPTPTSTMLGGLSVVVASTAAVIDGTTFTLGGSPTTKFVNGQSVSIGPNGIGVGSDTLTFASYPRQTEVIIAGGELMTMVGASVVVIHSTTYTYGQDIPALTQVVDDDTIIVGPSGVAVHGTTFGGSEAGSGTSYEIIGGATISQIGASVAVINGVTYTVGPGAGTTTTVIGGETITVGPSGIALQTVTLNYPFGPTVVTTLKPKATADAPVPAETSDNAGSSLRRTSFDTIIITLCIATGVWLFGYVI
jgi:hypothetical protein